MFVWVKVIASCFIANQLHSAMPRLAAYFFPSTYIEGKNGPKTYLRKCIFFSLQMAVLVNMVSRRFIARQLDPGNAEACGIFSPSTY